MSQHFLTWIHDKIQPDSRLVIEHGRDQDWIYRVGHQGTKEH